MKKLMSLGIELFLFIALFIYACLSFYNRFSSAGFAMRIGLIMSAGIIIAWCIGSFADNLNKKRISKNRIMFVIMWVIRVILSVFLFYGVLLIIELSFDLPATSLHLFVFGVCGGIGYVLLDKLTDCAISAIYRKGNDANSSHEDYRLSE